MKGILLRLFLFLLCLIPLKLQAGHFYSSELAYTYLDSGIYVVRLSIDRDCNGIQFYGDSLIYEAQGIRIRHLLDTANRVSVVDITGTPPNCPPNRCNNGTTQYGYERHTFLDTINLRGYAECNWSVAWYHCCHPGSITTGMSNQAHANFTTLNKCIKNSSPFFKQVMPHILGHNRDITLNWEVADSNDLYDSVSYELTSVIKDYSWGSVSNGTYIANFSPIRQLTFFGYPNAYLQWPAGFRIDPINGYMRFRPTQVNQVAVLSVLVKEWRKINGVPTVISTSRKEHTVIIAAMPNNRSPYFENLQSRYYVCIKDTLRIQFGTNDGDAADTTRISWSEGLPGGSLKTTNDSVQHATGIIEWIPTAVTSPDNPESFLVTVRDNVCPIGASYTELVFVSVHDSSDGPNADIGPDRYDSVGMDSFFVSATLQDYDNQELLWRSTGDGFFSDSTTDSTWYHPGLVDRKACAYDLFFFVLDSTPCLGNSKLSDTLTVWNILDTPDLVSPALYYVGDSINLSLSVDTSRGYAFAWTALGDGLLSDSSYLFTAYQPGTNDLLACSTVLVLDGYGCLQWKDSLSLIRKYEPMQAGADILVMTKDSAQLTASLNTLYAQQGYWRSLGDGRFSDSLDQNAWYTPGIQDWQSCQVELIWEEIPSNGCFRNADTVVLHTLFTGLDAGLDNTIGIYDTSGLLAGPVFNLGSGFWTSLGDGVIEDSLSHATRYTPGPQDRASCGTKLVWHYPYPQCSLESDTVEVKFNYSLVNAGVDQQIEYKQVVNLSAITAHQGQVGGWWTSDGDGAFSDSLNPMASYIPGYLDWYNCGSMLVWNTAAGFCSVEKDTLFWTRIPHDADAGNAVLALTRTGVNLAATPFANASMRGWWQVFGQGNIADSTKASTTMELDSASFYTCYGPLVWTTDSAQCLRWTDTTFWNRIPASIQCSNDIVGNDLNPVNPNGSISHGAPFWTSSGTGSFNNPTLFNPTYTPSAADKQLCEVWLYLQEYYPAACPTAKDSLRLYWDQEPIDWQIIAFDSCFADSVFLLVDTAGGGLLDWWHNGTGVWGISDANARYYIPTPEDFARGYVDFRVKRTGQCITDSIQFGLNLLQGAKNRFQAGRYGPIKVYPNPAQVFVTLDSYCPVNVYEATLYDVLGKEVMSWKIQDLPFQLNLESLAQAQYFLRVRLEAGRVVWTPVQKVDP
ncbi:MAG: T9SS type A sorting domain-containing protein [Bacteroidetes bacterium]|nr:MAG: T9SS type A sorting domain-containing protein [Bacteroidota bacterium]